jgi:hypothetical protein
VPLCGRVRKVVSASEGVVIPNPPDPHLPPSNTASVKGSRVRGDNQHSEVRHTLANLGLNHRRLHDWRSLRLTRRRHRGPTTPAEIGVSSGSPDQKEPNGHHQDRPTARACPGDV